MFFQCGIGLAVVFSWSAVGFDHQFGYRFDNFEELLVVVQMKWMIILKWLILIRICRLFLLYKRMVQYFFWGGEEALIPYTNIFKNWLLIYKQCSK
jgi:hypothetical protein